jgi:hypothetical protein
MFLFFMFLLINKIKVREITQNGISQNETTTSTTSLLNSVKYLEQDFDVMRRLYENEMRILRYEIDDINNERNKYTLELYNKELKFKETTLK